MTTSAIVPYARRHRREIVKSESVGADLLDLPANQQGAGRLPLPIAIGERAQHDEQAVVTDRTAERREHVIVELDIAQPEAPGLSASSKAISR
jgi:hypothetical protein